MGIVHVLTGPDHLSAIATLSVNVGNFRAFWFGVRWGVGHSIGLVVVGSFFIGLENIRYHTSSSEVEGNSNDALKDDQNTRSIEIPKPLENLAESFVGIFMLAMGFYNMYWAGRKRNGNTKHGYHQLHHNHHHCHYPDCDHTHDDDNDERSGTLSCDPLTAKAYINTANYGGTSNKISTVREEKDDDDDDDEDISSIPQSSLCQVPMGIEKNDNDVADRAVSKEFLSLCVGIAHGVAGPGGVLGVVPAVRLHNAWHSVAYLGSFCVSSIMVMGIIAGLYGSLSATWTRDNDRWAHRVEVFSAFLSLLVGCTWLVLLYLGILDEVFP